MSLEISDNESISEKSTSLNDAFIEEEQAPDEKSFTEKFCLMVDTVIERIEDDQKNLEKIFEASKETLKIVKALHLDMVYLKAFYDNSIEINDAFVGIIINFLTKLRDHLEDIYNFEPSECYEENSFREMGKLIHSLKFFNIHS